MLVVADDLDILLLAEAILAGNGYRVLVAHHTLGAVQLLGLEGIDVHWVGIRAGMNGCEQVHRIAVARGAKPWYFVASVEDGIIHMKGLEPVAVASVCLPRRGRNGNAFTAH